MIYSAIVLGEVGQVPSSINSQLFYKSPVLHLRWVRCIVPSKILTSSHSLEMQMEVSPQAISKGKLSL